MEALEFVTSPRTALAALTLRQILIGSSLILCFFWIASACSGGVSRFPSVNYNKSEWTYINAKRKFLTGTKRMIAEGFVKFSGPFTVVTGTGPLILLPPDMIEAVNQEPSLSFQEFTREEHLADLNTNRTFRSPPPGLFEAAVMKGLTRNLPKFTKVLSDEMTGCLDDTWGDSTEMHSIDFRQDVLQWVARLSTRIFMGERLSSNKEWLRISVDFTIDSFIGQNICKLFPKRMQWLVDAVLPVTRKVRRDYRSGAKILTPIIKERHDEIAAAKRENRIPDLPDDALEWFRNSAEGRQYDEVDLQLGLAVAAIHTTSDLLSQAVLNLCIYPEFLAPLRTEAVEVLSKYGWQKVALTELRLLDSLFKETQRLKPIAMTYMHRRATQDVELSPGFKILKGERLAISSHRMWSADDYEDPDRFNAFRFAERRKIPGLENRSLLVSTSQDHTAFSHGKHACPGRFFAANEVKIAMLHLLLKYDIELEDPAHAKWIEVGETMFANPKAKVRVRRRKAEIDLDQLTAKI